MGVLIDPVLQPEIALLRLLVAGLLGGLIGVERERDQAASARRHFAGVRTFPLFSMLGAGLVLIAGEVGIVVVVGFAAIAAMVVASYLRTSGEGSVGTTTEMAALATYWVGVMAGAGALLLAGALGVGVVVLLASKPRLEAFSRTLTREELTAALTLAVIAGVILPALPDGRYGPWGVWNPRQLWAMVVIVCGLSFAAFIGMRTWGSARGLYLSGVLGGLVSSTAATVSFAGRSRTPGAQETPLAVAAGLASLVMLIRVAVLAAVAGPAVLPYLLPVLGAALVAGGLVVGLLARRVRPQTASAPEVANPFQLREAIRFGAVYAVVLLAVEAASRLLGAWGLAAAAALAGLTDVDAITLALATATREATSPATAGWAIALAVLSNTIAKAGYAAWFGGRGFRRGTLVVLGAALIAGLAALLVTWPRLGA
jgi:uncharacterized membrane protein (DUF4010 family)